MDTIEIFIAYAREDEKYLDMLIKALKGPLKSLENKGLVRLWDERQIVAGTVATREIKKHLQAARIVLLVISADFIASDFCYSQEMQDLMRRHEAGEISIIPILLRDAYWEETPFSEISPLPASGNFIQSMDNKPEALLQVARGVRKAVDSYLTPSHSLETTGETPFPPPDTIRQGPDGPQQAFSSLVNTRAAPIKPTVNPSFDHGYALFIGIGGNLPVTAKDATALHDLFIDPARAGYPEAQVTLLTETGADRAHILAAFDHLIAQTSADPEATAIVYFSGHGGTFTLPGQPAEYFLVPHGYDAAYQAQTAISDQEFTAKITAIKARKLVVLLDCCHAAGMPALKGPGPAFKTAPVPPDLLTALQNGGGRVIIASSRANEYSYTGNPYSVFTSCLLEALSGKASGAQDGYARIFPVLSYLFDQIPPRTEQKQHPFVNQIYDLDDNFSLCYSAGGSGTTGGTVPASPAPTPTGLTPTQRQRLTEELRDIQRLRATQNTKVQRLRDALIDEDDILRKFKYERQLLQEEIQLHQYDDQIDDIEQQLQ